MVTPRTGRPPGRPADPGIRERLVESSWTLFLAHGVDGVTVASIAHAAGVSKASLYKHFQDKAALFDAGVRREQQRITAARSPAAAVDDRSLEQRLCAFGEATLGFITSDPAIDFYAVLAGDLRRHPDLARLFYDAGPGQTRASLTEILDDAVGRGELDLSDPARGADQLFGLWQGFTNFQLSLGIDVHDIRLDLARRVADGVATFLTAYRP